MAIVVVLLHAPPEKRTAIGWKMGAFVAPCDDDDDGDVDDRLIAYSLRQCHALHTHTHAHPHARTHARTLGTDVMPLLPIAIAAG